ncbi:hypothetical protein [Limosilactobacillus fermentum]|uniref:hypothetical protein n=1 Tax=Limosilactobacillus fermentum TaxID=1613 RepID=UPI003D76A690
MISEEKALKTYDQIEVNKKAAGDQLLLVAQFMTKRELERLEHRKDPHYKFDHDEARQLKEVWDKLSHRLELDREVLAA